MKLPLQTNNKFKSLTRQQVKEEFYAIIDKYGKPTNGKIFCEEQLISAIVHDLGGYDECNIQFENGAFEVSTSIVLHNKYAPDHTFIGVVRAKDWFTPDQLKALHELWFGYQF